MLSKLRSLFVVAACLAVTISATLTPATRGEASTPAPAGFHVTETGFDSISFAWSRVPGAEFYRVLVDGVWRSGVYDPTTIVTVTQLKPGTTYTFEVQALPTGGEYGPGSTLRVSTLADTEPPGAPTGLREVHDANGTSLGITWDTPTDNWGVVPTYRIFANDRLATVGGKPAIWLRLTDPYGGGLSCATTYTFTVQAWDKAGNLSPHSAPFRATTPTC